ncbi:hypothetical protein U0070_011359 [Myodes glareolus]|uniref:Uncharacterized protein n=1 Tax=Myodes glareolus TaxID=447135 RepID=A0AAW0HY84_MYOGA
MNRSDCHSLATQLHPLLLRRPLPPKFSKLPLSQKNVHTAITNQSEQTCVKLPHDESTSICKSNTAQPYTQLVIPSTRTTVVRTTVTPHRNSKSAGAERCFRSPSPYSANTCVTETTSETDESASAADSGKVEAPRLPDALIRTARRVDPEAHMLRGEGFKTIAATRYETIMAMSSLAIINCQLFGRNALNLKILHLKNLQVLKLRNNPIREIPSEIQQLKYLRNFCIAFNLIAKLPVG